MRFAGSILAAVPYQYHAAQSCGCVLGRSGHGGEERVAHIQHDQPDGAALSCPQLTGGVVADETEFGDGFEDALLGPLRYAVRIIQHVGNSSHCYLGVGGNVFDARCLGHAFQSPLVVIDLQETP
ncbi:hypothetical protein StoSoilB13_25600 [Arthrobacter sp. StoSoilB13]|nr:hypothetical protein StoSoilB13_25600 [Arthrobacter sp. StoSoilB13]